QEEAYHFFMQLLVWLITYRQVNPGFLIYDTLVVGESIKADFSMISAHAAFTKSSKSHFCSGKMDDRIIDAATAESAAGSHFFCRRFVGSKEVQRQRMRHGIDFTDHVIQVVKCQNRHERSEDFLLHDCILKGHMIQNRRLDAECFPIEVSTMHNLFLVNQPKNPVKMFFVD